MKTGTRILLRTITRNGKRLWAGTALIAVHQACETFVPILIGIVIDRAVTPGDRGQLLLWIGVLAAQFVLLTTAYRFGARQLMKAIAEEGHQLRLEVSAKILHPRGVRTDLRAGDLLTVSTSDADNTSYVLDYVPRIVGAIVATVISAVALIVISVPLGLVVLIATPIVLILLQVVSPLITRRVADQQEMAGRATSLATDLVTGLRPLRGLGAQDAAAERYRAVSRLSLRATLRASKTQGGYLAASTTLSTLLACGIAILAGWFALTGRISVGQFITVIGLAQFLIEPFGTLAVVPSWVAEARASADRVALVTDAGLLLPPGSAEPGQPCELQLTGVRHGTLTGLDLHVRPGEFVGVVARRASDADALVKLLASPVGYEGVVLLGGERLEDVERAHARRLLLVEPHHADLFTGTIATNVAVHGAGSSADALAAGPASAGYSSAGPGHDLLDEAVLRAAAADEVIASQADGHAAVVAERGASLSGGQRQRLALARALLARPPMLVLHDPTTAVDAVTEHAIAQGIRALRHGPGSGFGTIVITSSPALLAATDRVVVLGDGAVAVEGMHAGLGADDETYRQMVLR